MSSTAQQVRTQLCPREDGSETCAKGTTPLMLQLAREGHYETALALLLSEATMPLTVRDVHTWQQAIYAVLHLQASRA